MRLTYCFISYHLKCWQTGDLERVLFSKYVKFNIRIVEVSMIAY